jgi:pSer/pThr/pTyr-binding forkhead associated (FHA) protein
VDKFDALFAKITQERQIADGYFFQAHPAESTLLFVVNGAPYAAGRLAGEELTFLEIHEFFATYSRHPNSPLSFMVADKRLLLGLMVLFRHRPAIHFTSDMVDMEEVLKKLAARGADAIVGIRSGEEWAVTICTKGQPVANYFPASGAEALKEPTPAEQLLVYVFSRPAGGVAVDVYEETRVGPAGDASLLTPEMRGRPSEVYLKVAAKVLEAEAAPQLELEVAHEPEPVLVVEPEPAPVSAPEPPVAVPPEPVHAADSTLTGMAAKPAAPAPPPPAPAPPPAAKGPMPEIVLYLGDKQLGTFSLAKGELSIGRQTGNDIFIDNAGVSRRHAVIKLSGDRSIVEDLGSANGTFVNGQKIASHELRDGDEIMVVKHRMVYRIPKEKVEPPKVETPEESGVKTMFVDAAAIAAAMAARGAPGKPAAPPAPKPEAPKPELRPRLILPDLKKFALEMDEITIGTGADCQIKVKGLFLGKVHAKIVREKEGQFKIVHESGMGGTKVNGEKISEHTLKHGDEIEIGSNKLLFRLER